METETEPQKYRYYQIARDITWAFTWGDDAPHPAPDRVFERCLVTPDAGTHLCEAAVSSYVLVLDHYAEWDEDVSDEVREHYDELLMGVNDEAGFYMKYDDVFERDGKPKFMRYFDQGEDTEADAFEYAQGNHHA